ncbi:MAG: aminoacyl-tRNA hydrolase [Nitriliruptorales bacterium]|nr:aminoacyl-tRNA hydrolase [Nitriliruptorales bacterium]
MPAISVSPSVAIDAGEVELSFARSGGPGGQHVNTSSTKVELRFDLAASASLSDEQKARVRARLGTRLTNDGALVLSSSEHRSQTRNREAILDRFAALLREALAPPPPPRRRTRPSAAARRRRLDTKRRRGEQKKLRGRIDPGSG